MTVDRCSFGSHIPPKLRQAVELFEARAASHQPLRAAPGWIGRE
jgi:hypothetical protein